MLARSGKLRGYDGDLDEPGMTGSSLFGNDMFFELGIFREHDDSLEKDLLELQAYTYGEPFEYKPLYEQLEDMFDHWRIPNRVFSIAGADPFEAFYLFRSYWFFINYVSLIWNVTDIRMWQKTIALGRYFSNYTFEGWKENIEYDDKYGILVIAAKCNKERERFSNIRFMREHRTKMKFPVFSYLPYFNAASNRRLLRNSFLRMILRFRLRRVSTVYSRYVKKIKK